MGERFLEVALPQQDIAFGVPRGHVVLIQLKRPVEIWQRIAQSLICDQRVCPTEVSFHGARVLLDGARVRFQVARRW